MKYDLSKIEFKNEKRFLSNMYPAKIYLGEAGTIYNIPNIGEIISLGITYDSSEHLYQSLKSESDNWHRYLKNMSPEQTKTAARKCLKTLLANDRTTFLMRERWNEDLKLSAMEFVINLKFNQNKDLADLLIKIEGDIEERNCWGR